MGSPPASPSRKRARPSPTLSLAAEVVTSDAATVTTQGRRVTTFSAFPVDYERPASRPDVPPAREFPFVLDPFQQTSLNYIDDNESVLVAAHTSAGKTVMAEYAIAKSLRDGQRVVYTSPIKALSNQKFRDLQAAFSDVGLMTGDISINPNAKCLIMTTEILRSMLYRGSEIMREVAWVIYDEVHYMRDRERGIVWEESIILLPHSVRFVFLSATIPNAQQFATWIAKLHRQPCHVVYTDFRPTPLQHYVFPAGSDGLHLVVDDQNRFREDNFNRAMNTIAADPDAASGDGRGKPRRRSKKDVRGSEADLHKIIKLIMERDLHPVIVFSFAKKECEGNAKALSRMDFADQAEKDLITEVFRNAIASLSDEDQKLPQVEALHPLLRRGIGIHHGGMLPTLKEIVEVLFGEGLIKVLFATETFSIGINMPAKTVVFTKCRKFDGADFRWVHPGEYIQMSGRAGRRGLDSRGIVIQMLDEKMEPQVCKNMIYGEAEPLNSSFHISYNMLLNMMRVEGANPEFLMRSSFHQYQQELALPDLHDRRDRLDADLEAVEVENEAAIEAHSTLTRELRRADHEIHGMVYREEHVRKFLNLGRVVRVVSPDPEEPFRMIDYGLGVIVNYATVRARGPQAKMRKGAEGTLRIDVLMEYAAPSPGMDDTHLGEGMRPFVAGSGDLALRRVVTVGLENLRDLSAVLLKSAQRKDLRRKEARDGLMRTVGEARKRYEDGVPLLDAVADLRVEDEKLPQLQTKRAALAADLEALGVQDMEAEARHRALAHFALKAKIRLQRDKLQRDIASAQSLVMQDDLRRMRTVLRSLGHADGDDVIQLKGRVACEINSADELVATELMFNGVFADLAPPQVAALVSCLCFGEKRSDDEVRLAPPLQGPFQQLQEAARHVAKACADAGMDMDPDVFVEKFNPEMMEVLYLWASGSKFVDLCKITSAFEGSIIRLIRREEELLRQLSSASYGIGNMELRDKFDAVSRLIKRDICFAASLYL